MHTKLICGIKIIILAGIAFQQTLAFASDPFVGEYMGTIDGIKLYPYGNDKMMNAQISKHRDGYKLRLFDEPCKRSTEILLLAGLKAEAGAITLDNVGDWKFTGEATPDEINLKLKVGKDEGKISLKKHQRTSPTLGQKAPRNAIVLFDGQDTGKWVAFHGKTPCIWKINDDASMTVTRLTGEDRHKNQDIETKDAFGSFRLHLEFKTPDMSGNQAAQSRANSGLFIGPYEIQILDSFGNEGRWDDCGAIYRIVPPQVNASLPPETWQTYDIEFTAAAFENGKLTSLPKITVRHNGILVQNEREIPHGTSMKQKDRQNYKHPNPPYKLKLQDHNDPVSFRNIWIEKL